MRMRNLLLNPFHAERAVALCTQRARHFIAVRERICPVLPDSSDTAEQVFQKSVSAFPISVSRLA
jgi:hypothetical protein